MVKITMRESAKGLIHFWDRISAPNYLKLLGMIANLDAESQPLKGRSLKGLGTG